MTYNGKIRAKPKPEHPTVTIAPHTLHILGAQGSPIYRVVFDCGTSNPAYLVDLTADLAHLLNNRLTSKLKG